MADQYVWAAADGTVLNLSDWSAGYVVTADGTRGLQSVAYGISAQQFAGIDGTTVQAIRVEPNTPSLGLYVEAGDRGSFRAKLRGLVHAMRPKAGPGVLTVTTDSGTSRSLTCYCTGGLEGDLAHSVTSPGLWWRGVLSFYAPDPWWYGETKTLSVGLGAPTPFFPIFPLVLSASTVQGQFTVDLSDTDDPTPPVWTINGPGTSLTLTNQTTGQVIQVNAAIGSGEIMVIDTRPGHQSVRRGDGTNLMSAVASDPALWQLTDGVNQITAALAGATSESRITSAYRPRYSGI